MTLTEFIATVRSWTGYSDEDVHSDALITSWVRMAEEMINANLRIADMVQIDTATVYTRSVQAPADWLETDFLRHADGIEIRYMARPEFYAKSSPENYYTVAGRTMVIGGTVEDIDGTELELHYFGEVPELGAEATWLSTKFPRILTSATLAPASMFGRDAEAAASFENAAMVTIQAANDKYMNSSAKGGLLVRRKRGF